MDLKEIEEWWNDKPDLKRPVYGYWMDVTDWLISRVKELEKNIYEAHEDYRHSTNHQEEHMAELEASNKKLREAVNLAIESQGWDGNDPDDDRWTGFYKKARATILKE